MAAAGGAMSTRADCARAVSRCRRENRSRNAPRLLLRHPAAWLAAEGRATATTRRRLY